MFIITAICSTLIGVCVFKDGPFGNALATTITFLLILTVAFFTYCDHLANEEKEKAEKEAERKRRRVERGHLEDGLNPYQRIIWDTLHKYYRTDKYNAAAFIDREKKKIEDDLDFRMWQYFKRLRERDYAEYCRTGSTVSQNAYCMQDRFMRQHQKELIEKGILNKKGEYDFWDNFPDTWKLSDEELAAMDEGYDD